MFYTFEVKKYNKRMITKEQIKAIEKRIDALRRYL